MRDEFSFADVGRFWEKVQINVLGCWEWQAATQSNGYGRFGWNGRADFAHRVSYVLCRGQIPPGWFVCHMCDNPPCVRPDHLFAGTAEDNVHDTRSKGRMRHVFNRETAARGEQIANAKLTAEEVREIREYVEVGFRHHRIAAEFGVSRSLIGMIASRKIWAHVD